MFGRRERLVVLNVVDGLFEKRLRKVWGFSVVGLLMIVKRSLVRWWWV